MSTDLTEFEPVQLEKVEKLFEILESISQVRFLRERLAFYGGTCLNFGYFEGVPRLSVDLDFNYRSQEGIEWEDEWLKVDEVLKEVFYDIDYADEDISIQPKGPLKRFILDYERESGGLDQVEVEIGYQRRRPFLEDDHWVSIENPLIGESVEVRAPYPEELFSNKFCTMLYRNDPVSPRDVFDVYTISCLEFEEDRFRLLAILDSLTRAHTETPRLHSVPIEELLSTMSLDGSLRKLLRNRDPPNDLRPRVREFSSGVIDSLTDEEIGVIDAFHDEGEMLFNRLPGSEHLHSDVREHPGLRFSLQELGHRNDS